MTWWPPADPARIATDSLLLTVAGTSLIGLARYAMQRMRGAATTQSPLSLTFGIAIVMAALLSVEWFALSLLGSMMVAAGTPPIVLAFVALLAGVWLFGAWRSNGYGMAGCTRMVAISWGAYLGVWSLYWLAVFRPEALTAGSLMKPAVAALLPALAMYAGAREKDRVLASLTVFSVMAAWSALVFMTVENGFARDVLPFSDWLRFPLAGALAGLPLVALGMIAGLVFGSRAIRLKGMVGFAGILALVGVICGLAWAAARSLVG